IPKSFALARCAGVRPGTAVDRVWLDEAMDAMFIGELPRGHGIPEHRGQNRLQSCEVTHDSAVNESIEGWHEPFVKQRIDMLPVSRVPADEKNFASIHEPLAACSKPSH